MKMNGLPRPLRFIIVGAGLVVAFAAGAWVGSDLTGRMYGSYALPRATATADALHRKLLLLDRGELEALRQQIDMELDSELLGACMLSKDPSGGSQDTIATARRVLQRIARYRSEKPPSYPKGYPSLSADVRPKLQGCLDEARGSPGK